VPLHQLIERSDVLSVHVPLTAATKRRHARRYRRRAALYDALVGGKLFGAGLDVFEMEPADPNNPRLRPDQVVATPYMAGSVIAPRLHQHAVRASRHAAAAG
jgi:D-3-phosphoglycerate dehydrogenase / 2-oxoglutarate reductase